MSTTTKIEPKSTPTLQALQKELDDLKIRVEKRAYTLWYRYRATAPFSKNFYYEGDLHDAAEAGRRHCQIMGFRFVIVRPFIIDLRNQEARKLSNEYDEQDIL
jgi:hypothetical protein